MKRVIRTLFVLIFSLWCLFSHAQLKTDLSLQYLEREPAPSTQAPVIILLHGVGSNEQDLFSFAPALPKQCHVLSVRAPYIYGEGFGWFHIDFASGKLSYSSEEAEKSRKVLLKFIQEIKKKYNTSEVILIGFSQGAIMSFSVALTEPAAVKGIVALSGRILPEISQRVKPSNEWKKLSVFIGHGRSDRVLPVSNGKAADKLCGKLGVTCTYKEYEVAHRIAEAEMADVLKWLDATLDAK